MESRPSVRLGKYIAEKVSRAFAGRRNRPDVFISATSADLGTVRKIVRDTLLDSDCFPVEQSHFSPDYRKVAEMLRAKISGCQAMIHIAGKWYGCEPNPSDRPTNAPRRSYTQLEYHIAKELGIRCYIFVCPDNFPYDPTPDAEPPEKQKLQQAYRQTFLQSDTIYTEFGDRGHLREGVLKLQAELADLNRQVDQNRLHIWLMVLLNWGLLLLVAGALWWGIRQVADFRQTVVTELRHDRSPEQLQAQAAACFDGKNFSGAFHIYAQLSDADIGNVELHRHIEECARLGHLEKPFLDRCLALVQRHPDSAVCYNYLGNAYLLLDSKDKDGKAEKSYQAALRLDPRFAPPLANLGILASRAGRKDEAEAFFKRYLAVQPKDAQGWVNLGLLYLAKAKATNNDAGTVADAEKSLKQAITINPSSSAAYKALGRLWLATGRKKDALDAYQRSLALNADQPDVRDLLAAEFGDAKTVEPQADDFTTRSAQRPGINPPPPPAKDGNAN